MFFPNFSTFTLDIPLALRQRWSEGIRKYNVFSELSNLHSWDSNFVSTQKNWRHGRKRRLTSTFSYQLCSRRKQIFSYIERVHRTYVTVANQSTVHRTNPTKTRHTSVASPSNKSFRTNTFVRRQTHQLYFSNFSAWSENIIGRNQFFFSKPDSVNTKTVFTESPTKKYLHFANFQKAGQPLKEVSLDRQNSK